ncbi:SspB family protein [Microbaculum marinisediminis]|uniref:ClpXP protease specificity-enhancing factor SspB n=1 Tax=Microbaculum marinisediminis TaxID=2931392 RepID=A0AAW5R0H0_9HYPH|nr:ClpXP protease specificity-enhancing factor SspB [Microbaculum sp. A6E488]MCT8972644.1 ClpXP protease specificity-enhancing factor SspB [Microbaculum sp. A6E488]
MAQDLIRYDLLTQDALRGVVRTVLADVAKNGLPGDHHFFIGFSTTAPGVRVSNRLRESYPEEMTVVLQHQFWDLEVTDSGFSVSLSFNGIPERLVVPYSAIKGFLDPSVQFGLQFETGLPEEANDAGAVTEPAAEAAPDDAAAPAKPAKPARRKKDKAAPAAETAEDAADAEAEPQESQGAEVVSLDTFRKKT